MVRIAPNQKTKDQRLGVHLFWACPGEQLRKIQCNSSKYQVFLLLFPSKKVLTSLSQCWDYSHFSCVLQNFAQLSWSVLLE